MNLHSNFVASSILMLVTFLSFTSQASSFDYDGKWSIRLECGKLRVQGSWPNGFSRNETWNIEKGAEKYKRLDADGASTSWTVEIKDKKISLNGDASRGIEGWQWKMSGEIASDTYLVLKGDMYASGRWIRECSGTGSLVTPSVFSIAGKKMPPQVASVSPAAPSVQSPTPSTQQVVPATPRVIDSTAKPTTSAVQVSQNNAQILQNNTSIAQNSSNVVQNNTTLVQNNTKIIQNNTQAVTPQPKEAAKDATAVIANINVANDTRPVTSNPLDTQKKTSSNEVWVSFQPSISLQQRQFCRIVENFRTELVVSKNTRNEIKVNETYRNLMQSLNALLPDGKFQGWLMRTVRVVQERDGSADVLLQLPCDVLVGSNTCGDNPNKFTGIVPEGSRIYTELAKMSVGDFAITNGQFIYSDDKVFDKNRSVASFQYLPAAAHCNAKEFKTNPDFFGVALDTLSTIK